MTRVLIVDPSEERRSALAFQLRTAKYDVYLAKDGVTALDMLKKTRFDTVVTAQSMPGLTGSALLRHVRDEFRYFYLPFILLADGKAARDIEPHLAGDMSIVVGPSTPIASLLAALGTARLRSYQPKKLTLQ